MIYFIGAGPGAADLITVRGAELLKKADVIIYAGSLVNPALLDYAKEDCKIYNSAKMTLEEVIDVMKENKGKEVVRLHTGDPCIYGAIREQMDILDREEMEYVSVPGVSSFIGAAAALNAEYTLPNVSQTVILTRMAGRTPDQNGGKNSGSRKRGNQQACGSRRDYGGISDFHHAERAFRAADRRRLCTGLSGSDCI